MFKKIKDDLSTPVRPAELLIGLVLAIIVLMFVFPNLFR